MPASNVYRRLPVRPPGATFALAAILATSLAHAESPVEKGEQTGGIVPKEYLNQSPYVDQDAVSNTRAASKVAAAAGENVRVSEPGETSGSNENAVATNGKGGIIVGWQDSGTSRCCYATSADGGATWSVRCLKPSNTSAHAGDATAGASPDGALYAVCMDYSIDQVRISHTLDNGKTWSAWKSVQSAPDKPWVGAGKGGTVFISWLGDQAGWKRSQDYGETWEAVKPLGFINHGTTFGVGGNYVHVLFNQGNGLSYQRSVDGGTNAEPKRVLVSNEGTFCYSPCNPRQHPITGGGSDPTGKNVVAVWTSTMNGPGSDGDDDVWAVISRDYGATWTKPIRVNDNTARSRQIQAWAAADAYGRIHVAWTDLRNGADQYAVYYASTLDDKFGPNVEVTDKRSRASGFYGDYKGITIDGNDVLMTWVDSRSGRPEIYFTRGRNLAANPATAVAPGAPGYNREAVWQSKILYDLRGRRVRTRDAAAERKASGKYWADPERGRKIPEKE